MTKEESTLKTRLWIVNGLLGFILTIGVVLIPIVATQLIGSMASLDSSIKNLSESMAKQQVINENHASKDEEQDKRLDKNENRIHTLETK